MATSGHQAAVAACQRPRVCGSDSPSLSKVTRRLGCRGIVLSYWSVESGSNPSGGWARPASHRRPGAADGESGVTLIVEGLGLIAAAVAAAAAVRRIRGSSEPHGLPVALALLKLPTGAVTAVLGLLLMRGGFVRASALWTRQVRYSLGHSVRLCPAVVHPVRRSAGEHGPGQRAGYA